MNAADVLKYGHQTVLRTLKDLPQSKWQAEGVCGVWSVKNIMAHLASYELVLVEILNSYLGDGPTPYLDEYRDHYVEFNDAQVDARRGNTPAETLAEYEAAQAEVMALVARIPVETLRQPGTLPWYGAEYDLEDFLVYTYYGHKREHMAQVNVYKDTLKAS